MYYTSQLFEQLSITQLKQELSTEISHKLEIRSVERGICPIATSTMNELFL